MEILFRLENEPSERPLDEWRDENHGIRLQHVSGAHETQEPETDNHQRHSCTTLAPGHALSGSSFRLVCSKDLLVSGPWKHKPFYTGCSLFGRIGDLMGAKAVSHLRLPEVKLTSRDVNRWRMASRAIQLIEKHGKEIGGLPNTKLLSPRCGNIPESLEIIGRPVVTLGFSAAGAIYGGLHVLACSAQFGTATQGLLWRLSSCFVIVGLPLIYYVARLETQVYGILWGLISPLILVRIMGPVHFPALRNDPLRNIMSWIIGFLKPLITLAYVLARAYLVVECFINLFNLPVGVYDTPNWSIYFPHIT